MITGIPEKHRKQTLLPPRKQGAMHPLMPTHLPITTTRFHGNSQILWGEKLSPFPSTLAAIPGKASSLAAYGVHAFGSPDFSHPSQGLCTLPRCPCTQLPAVGPCPKSLFVGCSASSCLGPHHRANPPRGSPSLSPCPDATQG